MTDFGEGDSMEKFKNEPEFYKAYKLYNSLPDSIRGFNCITQYHIFANLENYHIRKQLFFR